jgi:hypothetical protein
MVSTTDPHGRILGFLYQYALVSRGNFYLILMLKSIFTDVTLPFLIVTFIRMSKLTEAIY